MSDLEQRGWQRFAWDPGIARWAKAAHAAGLRALKDPALSQWYQCENTWFVGVDALPNEASGTIDAVPLTGAVIDTLRDPAGALPALHKAQLSVMLPGYPRPRQGEGEGAFRYRLNRDAAHVDGLLAEGAARRRHLREPHAWILGLPLNESAPDAAPLVVWEGSHRIMGTAFAQAFEGLPPDEWGEVDVTDVYQTARRAVFETCRRVTVPAAPGEAYVVHRLALHGVAPWRAPAAPGRMIAYFRPEVSKIADWLAGV